MNLLIAVRLFLAGLTELRKTRYDIIYCMTPIAGIVGRLLSTQYRLPLVVRLFGVFLQPDKLSWTTRLARLEEIIAIKMRSDLLIITDDGTPGDLIAAKLGVAPDRVLLLRNGIDREFFEYIPSTEARRLLGIDTDGPIVLWVSRFVRWKRWDRLIGCIPYVISREPKAKFILLGDGPDRDAILKFISKQGIQKHVHLPGFVPTEQVALYMSASDVLVSTNDHGNAGNPVLQAMAKGLPVIVAGEGGTPGPEGEALLRVPPDDPAALADAVLRVISDRKLSRSLRSCAYKAAQNIGTWEHRIEEELNVIKRICNEY